MSDDPERVSRATLEAIPQIVWTAGPSGQADWYNTRWYAYTGQTLEESRDRGYARAVHRDDIVGLREAFVTAVRDRASFRDEHRLRDANGAYRWYLLTAQPLHDADGRLTRWIGVATDVDARRRAADEMAFLADASEALSAARDLDAALAALVRHVVPSLSDWCSIYLMRDDALVPHTIHHRDPAKRAFAWDIVRRYPPHAPTEYTVLRSDDALYVPTLTAEMIAAAARDETERAAVASLDIGSLLVLPLSARGTPLGVLQLARETRRDPFAPGDRDLGVVVAQRTALAIDNARIAARERQLARTFQDAALPRVLPRIEGLRLDVVYVAGDREAGIGGDWYDAFVLRDGRLVVSIGDVAGMGVDAAVLMTSLRQAIRVAAYQQLDPAAILDATDEALTNEAPDRIATAFVGILDPRTWTLTYASAGHPPALLRSPGGALLSLTTGGTPLGVRDHRESARTLAAIPPGSLLVTYTDGLTESTQDVLEGERRVFEVLRDDAVVHAANPARFVRDVVLHDGSHDDVAILVVGFGRDAHWSFDAEDAMAAHGARASFVAWLRRDAEPDGDFAAAELIFGELIGNVVRYAPGPIDIAVEWNAEQPVLHVLDRGRSFDLQAVLPADMLSESGRGLFIVDALGTDLSARAIPGRGNHVRVGLPVRRRG